MKRGILLFVFISLTLFMYESAFAATNYTFTSKAAVPDPSDPDAVDISWEIGTNPPGQSVNGFKVHVFKGSQDVNPNGYNQPGETLAKPKGKVGETFTIKLYTDNTKTTQLASTTVTVAAAGTNPGGGTTTTTTSCDQSGAKNGYQFCDTLFGDKVSAPDYIASLYTWAIGIAVIGASLMIIYAGYRYTVSQGNPTEIGNAKEIIVSALVGLALLLLSYTILRFIGVNVLDPSKINGQNPTTNNPP